MEAGAYPTLRRGWPLALLAVAAAVVSLLVFTPRFVVWRGLGIPDLLVFPEVNRASDALRQLHDPFKPIANLSNRAIRWRLLMPLAAHELRLPDRVFLGVPAVGALLALMVVAGRLRRGGWRWDEVFAGTLLAGTCSWFFVSTGWLAYFDSWLMLGLLLCSFARQRSIVAGAILLTPWIDERFVIALPLCLALRETGAFGDDERGSRERRMDALVFAGALLPFAAIRLGAYVAGGAAEPRAYLDLLRHGQSKVHWTSFLVGAWHGLRFGWVPVALWMIWVWRKLPRRGAGLVILALATLTLILLISADFSRSASALLPLALAGLVQVFSERPELRRRWVWSLAALNLIAPASHVVYDSAVRILPFYHELALWRNPPLLLRADYYNMRAVVALSEERTTEALQLFDAALKLDPDFQPAHVNYATALERTGRLAEAVAEADKAIALDPTHARAWFRRGNIRRKLGETSGAKADLQQARLVAASDDPIRLEAERLLDALQTEAVAR